MSAAAGHTAYNDILSLGPTWFRRWCGFGTGHVEHQSARKSIWKKTKRQRSIVRTRRLIPVSLATVGPWAGSESQDKDCEVTFMGWVCTGSLGTGRDSVTGWTGSVLLRDQDSENQIRQLNM